MRGLLHVYVDASFLFELTFAGFKEPDSAAMFPGRYPAVPDNMWAFWNPQAMGLQGQFCGGDLMNQQSQAQSSSDSGATGGSQRAK